jgi:tRNA threonylcarbamoyladenosine biosynthesis protein TsaB
LADARGQQMAAFLNYSAGKFEDVAYYEPFYLKDFIAGIKKG